MSNHSAGPWHKERDTENGWMIHSQERSWKFVAQVTANSDGAAKVSSEEAEANANLIVASPNLLKAARDILRFIGRTSLHQDYPEMIALREAVSMADHHVLAKE